jgi:NodT family efflux transporter outer membrane factor (OMF) lipoprotein
MTIKTVFSIFVAGCGWLLLAGCAAVGPDYISPKLSAPVKWSALPGSGISQHSDTQVLAHWWETFRDPLLSELIEKTVAGNLDLKQAKSRVRQARAERGIKQAASSPTVDAAGSFKRSGSSGQIGNLYQLGMDAGWELDVFGGLQRSVEAAQASVEASEADLRDVLVSLLSEVALDYLDVRTYQNQIATVEKNLISLTETFELTTWRAEAGQISQLDVEQARYNLEQTRAQLPSLKTSLNQAKNALALLLGKEPGSLHRLLDDPKPIPTPPTEVAIGVPAEALRQRPDIRKAERELAAQTATVGVATAELYPEFSLSGSIGLEALASGKLFSKSSRTWQIAPGVNWNIFDAGRIRKNIEVQNELQEQALLGYEATVLDALREVENALVAYADEQQRRNSLDLATQAAGRANDLAQQQYQAGLVDYLSVLETQRTLLSLQQSLAECEGQVMGNLVRLYKALGGGWGPLTTPITIVQGDTL